MISEAIENWCGRKEDRPCEQTSGSRNSCNNPQRAATFMVFGGRNFGGRIPTCAVRAPPHEPHLPHKNALTAQKRTKTLFCADLRCFCAVVHNHGNTAHVTSNTNASDTDSSEDRRLRPFYRSDSSDGSDRL